MTQDLNYYDSGYFTPDHGYLVYTADAEALVTSTASLTVAVSVIKEASSTMTVEFTQTSMISDIRGVDMFAMSNAALDIQVQRLRDNNIQASSAFTISTSGQRIRYISAEEDSAFSITANNLRVRFQQAALDAAFSLAGTVDKFVGLQSNQSSSFTITATGELLARNIYAEANLLAAFTQSSTAGLLQEGVVECDALFTPNVSCQITKNSFATLDSTSVVSAQVDRIGDLRSSLAVSSVVSAQVDRIGDLRSSLTSSVSISVTPTITRSTTIALNVSADININYGRTRNFNSVENALFNETLTCKAIRNSFAVLNSTSNLTAVGNVSKEIIASLTSTASQTSVGARIRYGNSALTSTALLSQPYSSFANKRPRSAYTVGTLGTGFGLVTTQKKFGSGSYYAPGASSGTKGLLIQAKPSGSLNIAANENFYMSAWINIDADLNVATVGTRYPLMRYQDSTTNIGWEIGVVVVAIGSNQLLPYFRYNSTLVTIDDTTSLGSPVGWSHYEVYRSGSTLTIRFENSYVGGHSPVSKSVTFSGAIGATTPDTYALVGGIATGCTAYFDELYFAKGISAPVRTKGTGEIGDGKESTTQFLYHLNGDFTDDVSGITSATASLNSTALVIAQLIKTAKAASALTSTASFTASVTKVISAQAELTVDGFLVTSSGRIRPFIDLEQSNATLTAGIAVTRNTGSNLQSFATESIAITKVLGPIEANLSSNVTLSLTPHVIKDNRISLSITSTVVPNVSRTRGINSQLQSEVTLNSLANPIRNLSSSLQSNVSLSTIVLKVKQLSATFNSTASTLEVINKIGNTLVDLQVITNLNADVSSRSGSFVPLTVSSAMVTFADAFKHTAIHLDSSSSLVVIADSGKLAEAHLVSTSSLSINANAVQHITSNISSTASLSCSLSKIYAGISLEVAASRLTIQLNVIKSATSNLASTVSLRAIAGNLLQGSASLQCDGFEIAIVRRLQLKNAEVYIVPADNNTWIITPDIDSYEVIEYIIPSESTLWKIQKETNFFVVPYEDRNYKIKG